MDLSLKTPSYLDARNVENARNDFFFLLVRPKNVKGIFSHSVFTSFHNKKLKISLPRALKLYYSQSTYSRSRPHREPIGWHNFNKVGTQIQSSWDSMSIRLEPIVSWHMSLVLIVKEEEWAIKVSDYDRLYISVICSGQLLASKIHSDFNLRN